MPSIPTLDEAIDAVDTLKDAADTLKRFLDGIETTFRSSRVQKPAVPYPERLESLRKNASEDKNGKTATWPDRVRAILREGELAAKDVIRIYIERHGSGESSPEEVGHRIRSVLWQMKGRDQLSHDKTTGKYQLKEKPP